jgi:hypothetical protein
MEKIVSTPLYVLYRGGFKGAKEYLKLFANNYYCV